LMKTRAANSEHGIRKLCSASSSGCANWRIQSRTDDSKAAAQIKQWPSDIIRLRPLFIPCDPSRRRQSRGNYNCPERKRFRHVIRTSRIGFREIESMILLEILSVDIGQSARQSAPASIGPSSPISSKF
jgi:hypothetical protein